MTSIKLFFLNRWIELIFILHELAFRPDVYKATCTSKFGDKWQLIIHWVLTFPSPAWVGARWSMYICWPKQWLLRLTFFSWWVRASLEGQKVAELPVLLARVLSGFLMLCQGASVASNRRDLGSFHDKEEFVGMTWGSTQKLKES